MMRDNPDGTISFEKDTTFRWEAMPGDFVVWFRWANLFAAPEDAVRILDLWELRPGDVVTMTNRFDDLPRWFPLNPSECRNQVAYKMMAKLKAGYVPEPVAEGPNIWRVQAGDRLVFLVAPRPGSAAKRRSFGTFVFRENTLVVGESLGDIAGPEGLLFGGLSPAADEPAVQDDMRRAVAMVRRAGPPREIDDRWALG